MADAIMINGLGGFTVPDNVGYFDIGSLDWLDGGNMVYVDNPPIEEPIMSTNQFFVSSDNYTTQMYFDTGKQLRLYSTGYPSVFPTIPEYKQAMSGKILFYKKVE